MSDILNVQDVSQVGEVTGLQNGKAVIKVIGIGGGGGNTVSHMVSEKVEGVDFYVVNTDLQALNSNVAENKIQIGVNVTRGLGSGSNPSVGKAAAEESVDDLREKIGPSDITFVTAGMGGGTGTGASPVIAKINKENLKSLTVAIVTKPFSFEQKKKMMIAEEGIEELRKNVDAIVVIPNDKLLKTLPEDVTLMDAFMECNRVLMKAVKGVSDIIYKEGYMNLDFNDVRAVLSDSGEALIGMGIGEGETGVDDALEEAINCPLLEDVSNMIPSGIIVNVSVPNGFTLKKLAYIGQQIEAKFPTDSIVKYGVIYDSNLKKDQISATVLLTGLKPRENVDTIQEDNDGLDLGGAFVEDVPAQAQKPASSFGEYSLPSFLTRKG